ncbi:MAG: hypothetical protein GX331_08290 [Firmicutes bacterium]|jgi:hypothetical protein|nr:hypothetical protein [Bacillota bacterium]
MIKAEVSLYPAHNNTASELAGLSLRFLDEHGLDYDFYYGNTSLNTTISGPPKHVWNALEQIFEENKKRGQDIVMVTTLTNWE